MIAPRDIIAIKRDGGAIPLDALQDFIAAIAGDRIDNAQIGAFAMAVFLNGLTDAERITMTEAMRDSGTVLDWALDGPVIDKHSTGGIGDTVSLMRAPALAACGAFVPMISGRGLGHTGGTLDKLDAIPGYRSDPDLDRLRRVVAETGCAIIGQTGDLAPADRRLYAIRDVTGTVESIDLICASILSKKLAAGLDALVLDVKVGRGAFMDSAEQARQLAKVLVDVAKGARCRTTALLTDMNAPLATSAGNALEMDAAIKFLRGAEIDGRLWDVTVALGGAVLATAGLAADRIAGAARISDALQSGQAAERFQAMSAALGGPTDFVDNYGKYALPAPVIRDVTAPRDGFVTAIDTKAIGNAVVALGGGRLHPDDIIDLRVGFDWLMGIGQMAEGDTPIARVHARDDATADRAEAAIRAAYKIGDQVPAEPPLILEQIT